jgi:hypothetical protein
VKEENKIDGLTSTSLELKKGLEQYECQQQQKILS